MTTQALRAGPLSMLLDDGDIRNVRLGRHEILQRVYIAVRDRNWGTVPKRIVEWRLQQQDDSFQVRYQAECRQREIDFRYTVSIRGSSEGEILWELEGVAVTSFLKNRAGFCVLHPSLACAGARCSVETIDGAVQASLFPRFVAPHQPFRNIRAIRHEVEPGITAEVRFTGDVFEMEDQRNWTDASFKTYSTPLSLPFPARIEAGTAVRQSVRLMVRGATVRPPDPEGPIAIEISGAPVPMPPLGLGGAGDAVLDARAVAELARLRLAHLRLDLNGAHGADALEIASINARALGVGLEIAVGKQADIVEVAAACARIRPPVARWLVAPDALPDARQDLPPGCLAAGSDANFAELNRRRPDPSGCDALWFALNPQVHAFDDLSLIENLPAQASAVESAHGFAGGKPVLVSPVTLKPRCNAVATEATDDSPPADPRQRTWFCAAWTLGSLRYLSGAGAASVTYYEIEGDRGVLYHPVWDLLAAVGEFAGGEILPARSSQPRAVEALLLRQAGRTRLMLANFTGAAQAVDIHGETFTAAPYGITTRERS
jgi:D-apionolactonase